MTHIEDHLISLGFLQLSITLQFRFVAYMVFHVLLMAVTTDYVQLLLELITRHTNEQYGVGGIHGTVVARWTAGQQVKRSILRHIIHPGCLRPSIDHGLKHQLFHFI